MRAVASILVLVTALAPLTAHALDPREEALGLSKQGLEAYLAGSFAQSSTLYGRAYRTWPAEPLYLYNAARSAERAGQLADAERMYSDYLVRAPAGQAEVAKARFHLGEIRAAQKTAVPAPTPTAPRPLPAPTPPHAASSSRSTAGTVLLVAGGVAAIGGGVVLAMAASYQSTLNGRLGQTDASGRIIGISQGDATSQQNSINTREYAGWTVLGAGVVAGVIGAVLLATAPSVQVSVAPWVEGHGAVVAGRF